MIDSHCHLCHIEDADAVVIEARRRGMKALVTSALNLDDAKKSLSLREKYPNFVFVCLGIHPGDIEKFSGEQLDEYIEFVRQNRKNIVAVGEIGLDYNWVTDENRQESTKEAFAKMTELAASLDLPVVVHTRNGPKAESAVADALEILKKSNARHVMMHCFSGNENDLREALGLGYFISYATNICWTKKHPHLATMTPMEKMVLETDSPWLDPDASDKKKLENRPWKIEKSAEIVAKLKGIPKDEVLRITAENAIRFFNLNI